MKFPGVSMFPSGSLSSLGLTSECESALYQKVYNSIAYLIGDGYVDDMETSTQTDLLCDSGCEASISKLHDAVAANCSEEAELVPGLPFQGLVDQVWNSWNQPCFVDRASGKNCNYIVSAFPDVTEPSDLPISDLCSYCYVKNLELMQADAYTDAYNSNWQSTYEYMAEACNLTVPNFNAASSAFNVTVPVSSPDCVPGNMYTTKEGDTCDSIALSQGVSAATMFHINPNILNCSPIQTGTSLCLPQQCDSLYTVQPNDTCTDIAINSNIRTQALLAFNPQLTWNCSNLHTSNPYWGSTLCVSPPGGSYTGQAPNTSTSTEPEAVNPPAGATVAAGSTTDCGTWYVNDASNSLTCTQICLSNQIAIKLFTQANPSLNVTTCDKDLIPGNAYCVNPLTDWSYGNGAATTTGSFTPTVTAATSPPAATQTGIPSNCNAYYVAKKGDDCGTVEALFGLTNAQFHAWNPAISSDCVSGFLADEAYCVGVSTTAGVTTTTGTSVTTSDISRPVSTSHNSAPVKPPGPTQTGIPESCSAYYIAKSGDTCATVVKKYGITNAQFHDWNPAVSSDCVSGFMADEAYCIAVE